MKAWGLLGVVTLAGCLSVDPARWALEPDAQTRAKRDIYECRADADGVSHEFTARGGAIQPILGLFARRSAFRSCMESRGYRPE